MNNPPKPFNLIVSILFISLVIALYLLAIRTLHQDNSFKLENFGMLGDSFGIITCLFSGLAICLLKQSIDIQKKELHEIKEQTEQNIETQRFQRFENTFFNLIKTLEDNLEKIESYKKDKPIYKGSRVLDKIIYDNFDKIIYLNPSAQERIKTPPHLIKLEADKIFNSLSFEFLPFCKTLDVIVEFFEKSLPAKSPNIYIDLLKTKIGISEEMLLLTFGCSDKASERFCFLAKKYAIFSLASKQSQWDVILNIIDEKAKNYKGA